MESVVLRKLDFAPGIKAKDINNNFEAIHEWLRRERKHVGGYGLTSGFDMKVDPVEFTVTIGEGCMVNKAGEEIVVPENTFYVGPPEFTVETERIVCPSDGIITLRKTPYLPSTVGNYIYAPPVSTVIADRAEFRISCEAEGSNVHYLYVDGNEVHVSNPSYWNNKELTVQYCSSKDRVDSILLDGDGKYYYARSVISSNPSHVNLEDCIEDASKYMLVGVVQWLVRGTLSAYLYDNHRTYRRVYVDDDNRLYLNGKLYRESQIIYLEKPEEPEPYAFWYDLETNILYIYRQNGAVWDWIPVNDTSTSIIRETKMWTPDAWPKWTFADWDPAWPDWPFVPPSTTMTDAQIADWKDSERKKVKDQLFLFGEDETNLTFVPGQNELIIIVDNTVLMSDQYTEVLSEKEDGQPAYMSVGVGFLLKEPLDHPGFVQVIVNHSTRTKPAQNVFQRAAIFVNDGFAIREATNINNIFETEYPYIVGSGQLEVWLDGIRIAPGSPGISGGGVSVVEMKDRFTDATPTELAEQKLASKFFRIDGIVSDGTQVSWRISKYVWNYDQVSELISSTTNDIAALKKKTDDLQTDFNNMGLNISNQLNDIVDKINILKENQMPDDISPLIQNDSIGVIKLASNVRNHMVGTTFNMLKSSTEIVSPIPSLRKTDFIQVHCIENDRSLVLAQGIDYSLSDTTGGLRITLSSDYAGMSQYQFYISGFTLGA